MDRRHLIVMRHATAGAGTGRDFDRPLTRRGFDEAERAGERLRATGPLPDRALVSSARRCRETWQAMAAALASASLRAVDVALEDDLYNAATGGLLEAIRDRGGDAAVVLVLAHNPGISLLALELGSEPDADEGRRDPRLRDGFAPATFAVFEIDGAWRDLAASASRLLRIERPEPES
jgi:phosphohistidine phosphatase